MISIFVAKLDFGVDSIQLRKLFEQHGKVLKATVATDRETGNSRGFAFVEMENEQEGFAAIQALDGFAINGRNIAVKQADQKNDSRGGGQRTEKPSFEPKPGYNPNIVKSPAPDFTPGSDEPSKEARKKLPKDKKSTSTDQDRSKKPKMDAYKKTGKKNQFFDDDDDDLEGGLFSFNDPEEEDED